ncbi:hypothetical protein Efla_002415 [Eimeria flavescens]
MGNFETALAQEGGPPEAPCGGSPPNAAEGVPPEGTKKAGSGGKGRSGSGHNPGAFQQTEATSIPLSVPEVESETDVGAPSPSPPDKGSWGLFSPPEDMDVLCPTPFQSTCVDQGGPPVGGPCSAPGSNHQLSCFEEAVGRALTGEGVAGKGGAAAGGPHDCPHLAAARERQQAIPPSLLALGEIIRDSMRGPHISGLHLNSPSASPRWQRVPGVPRGSPVGPPEGSPPAAATAAGAAAAAAAEEARGPKRLKEAAANEDASTRGAPGAPSTRDASTDTLEGGPGGPAWPSERFREYAAANTDKQQQTGQPKNQGASAREEEEAQEEDLVRVCCAHIVNRQGRLGSSSNRNSSSSTSSSSNADCPLEALQQLSPRLHECAEALSRTLLLQASAAEGGAPVGRLSMGALSPLGPRGPPLSDASLHEVASRLTRLQTSIDQFTSVLRRCEGRLLSALYGCPSRGPPPSSLPPVAPPRGGPRGPYRGSYMEALGLGEGSKSGAPSSNDTTRAQPGSPSAYRDAEEGESPTPVFFINRESPTPFGGGVPPEREGGDPEALRMNAFSEEALSAPQRSSAAMGGSFSSLLRQPPSGRTSDGDSGQRGESKREKRGTGRGALKRKKGSKLPRMNKAPMGCSLPH